LPVTPPSQPSPSQPSTAQDASAQVHLSAGVALGQTLPSGTGMFFIVDYEFTRGRPDSSTRYYLVITPTQGTPLTFDVKLSAKGNLQALKERMVPELGPFLAHLEAAPRSGSRKAISQKVRLKNPGG
jgi:hypothetical protein